mgnify:FL=1
MEEKMKVSIVYASTTGNTEQMANVICEALKDAGAETAMVTADAADAAEVLASDVILLGSPAMGDEVLEDSMENFFAAIEGSLSGKKLGLFGSYDWGDGQWMRDWEDRAKAAGATLVADGLIAHLAPEADDLENCRNLAAAALK